MPLENRFFRAQWILEITSGVQYTLGILSGNFGNLPATKLNFMDKKNDVCPSVIGGKRRRAHICICQVV